MFILDRLLVGGLGFVLEQVSRAADAEGDDETAIRERLLAAQLRLELGEISAAEFARLEAEALTALRRTRRAPGRALDADSVTDVQVTFGGDERD